MTIPAGLCQCGCGTPTKLERNGTPRKYAASGHTQRGRISPKRFERQKTSLGYWKVFAKEHPRAVVGLVFEHIIVAERALGHYLPAGAEIHHVDEDKGNNTPSNLLICQDHTYHMLLHRRLRALRECGDPSARNCGYCHSWENQQDIRITPRDKSYHRSCEAAYQRTRKLKLRSQDGNLRQLPLRADVEGEIQTENQRNGREGLDKWQFATGGVL